MKKTYQLPLLIEKDEDKFKGEYLIVIDKKILAHSKDCKRILPLLKRYPKKAIITKVPTIGWKEAMVLYGKV